LYGNVLNIGPCRRIDEHIVQGESILKIQIGRVEQLWVPEGRQRAHRNGGQEPRGVLGAVRLNGGGCQPGRGQRS
jgi:hypothetical protein